MLAVLVTTGPSYDTGPSIQLIFTVKRWKSGGRINASLIYVTFNRKTCRAPGSNPSIQNEDLPVSAPPEFFRRSHRIERMIAGTVEDNDTVLICTDGPHIIKKSHLIDTDIGGGW